MAVEGLMAAVDGVVGAVEVDGGGGVAVVEEMVVVKEKDDINGDKFED